MKIFIVLLKWIGLILGVGCISVSNVVFMIMTLLSVKLNENISETKKIVETILNIIIHIFIIILLINSIIYRSWELAFTATAINFMQSFIFLKK